MHGIYVLIGPDHGDITWWQTDRAGGADVLLRADPGAAGRAPRAQPAVLAGHHAGDPGRFQPEPCADPGVAVFPHPGGHGGNRRNLLGRHSPRAKPRPGRVGAEGPGDRQLSATANPTRRRCEKPASVITIWTRRSGTRTCTASTRSSRRCWNGTARSACCRTNRNLRHETGVATSNRSTTIHE